VISSGVGAPRPILDSLASSSLDGLGSLLEEQYCVGVCTYV